MSSRMLLEQNAITSKNAGGKAVRLLSHRHVHPSDLTWGGGERRQGKHDSAVTWRHVASKEPLVHLRGGQQLCGPSAILTECQPPGQRHVCIRWECRSGLTWSGHLSAGETLWCEPRVRGT